MKTNHTPAPWIHAPELNKGITHGASTLVAKVFPDNTKQIIAAVWKTDDAVLSMRQDKEGYANARLIAAAPDLLAALENTLRVLVTCGGFPEKCKGRTNEQQAAFDAAKSAIAKAKGGKL